MRASSRASRPSARLPRRRSTTCSSSGPGSATTRARATCMPARRRSPNGMADEFPDTEDGLRTLPGIGAYTAAAIAAIAFDQRASPVDGNIERVIARLFAVEEELPGAKPRIRALAGQLTPQRRAGDFAQAMMDLGATHLHAEEAGLRALSVDARLARRARAAIRRAFRARRRRRPARCAAARRSSRCARTDHILLRTRPEKGLARRHDRSADDANGRSDFDDASALDAAPLQAQMAPHARRGHARLHAFSAAIDRPCGERCKIARERPQARAGCRRCACRRRRCRMSCAR